MRHVGWIMPWTGPRRKPPAGMKKARPDGRALVPFRAGPAYSDDRGLSKRKIHRKPGSPEALIPNFVGTSLPL